jgi:hypothetical protein
MENRTLRREQLLLFISQDIATAAPLVRRQGGPDDYYHKTLAQGHHADPALREEERLRLRFRILADRAASAASVALSIHFKSSTKR